jgi:branched-chain amino acid transport system permease protein
VATTIVGVLLDQLALKRARRPTVLSLIIITVGASIFIRGLSGNAWGKDAVAMPSFSGDQPLALFGASIAPQALWVLGITVVVMVAVSLFFTFTIPGKALRACAVNRQGARIVGINVKQMATISFALSAALGAIGGIIIAPITLANYGMGTILGVKGFAAAALGGLTSGPGAVLGGFTLGILESLGTGFVSSAYKDAIALVVLFLVLFLRPSGLLGGGGENK